MKTNEYRILNELGRARSRGRTLDQLSDILTLPKSRLKPMVKSLAAAGRVAVDGTLITERGINDQSV
jgi:DNA-binding MarR family transcriptional regulator